MNSINLINTLNQFIIMLCPYKTKYFAESSAGFFMLGYPGYPSYMPGVFMFEAELPDGLFGFTNGKAIVRRKGMSNSLKEFVLLHEEEHVKDMPVIYGENDFPFLGVIIAEKEDIWPALQAFLKKDRWAK